MSWFEGLGIDRGGRKDPKRDLEKEENLPMVAWVPPACSSCGSTSSRIYRTSGLVRYHRCKSCGQRFISKEVSWAEING